MTRKLRKPSNPPFIPPPGLNVTEQPNPEDLVAQVTAYKHNGKLYESVEAALAGDGERVLHETVLECTHNGEFDVEDWIKLLKGTKKDLRSVISYLQSLKP